MKSSSSQRPPGGKGPGKEKERALPLSSKSRPSDPPRNFPPTPPSAAPNNPASPPRNLSPPPNHTSSPAPFPPPPPAYGFHMLERRTIVLADGGVRSYFALPPDYPMDPSADPFFPYGAPVPGLDPPSSLKRKLPLSDAPHSFPALNGDFRDYPLRPHSPSRRPPPFEDERMPKHPRIGGPGDAFADAPSRGDAGGIAGAPEGEPKPSVLDVDPEELQKAYLKYAKIIYDSPGSKRKLLDDGKSGNLSCAVCGGRPSKEFPDVHRLVMHTYTCTDSRADHLGLHKALCVLMGWNYAVAPDNGKAYQSFSVRDAEANRDELIIWPPHVIMQNTSSGKRKDGRVEGMGNKEVDVWLREAGFGSGKAKSLYGKEGHLGITIVKFADNEAGLMEAERLAEFLITSNHGREGWALAQASQSTHGNEGNLLLVKLGKKGEEKRILYGYLATAPDLDIIEFDTRRKLTLRCRSEFGSSS